MATIIVTGSYCNGKLLNNGIHSRVEAGWFVKASRYSCLMESLEKKIPETQPQKIIMRQHFYYLGGNDNIINDRIVFFFSDGRIIEQNC